MGRSRKARKSPKASKSLRRAAKALRVRTRTKNGKIRSKTRRRKEDRAYEDWVEAGKLWSVPRARTSKGRKKISEKRETINSVRRELARRFPNKRALKKL